MEPLQLFDTQSLKGLTAPMLQNTINLLNQDIAIVQQYIKNSQDAGFQDMARLLEGLSIQLFKASHGLILKNKNQLHPTFPPLTSRMTRSEQPYKSHRML